MATLGDESVQPEHPANKGWGAKAATGGLWLLLLLFLGVTGDSLRLNAAEQVAGTQRYNLILWHLANSPDKWLHQLSREIPWRVLPPQDGHEMVVQYFSRAERLSAVEAELNRLRGQGDGSSEEAARLETESALLREAMANARNDVEEALETLISDVAVQAGLGYQWFLFPPVDFRLTPPPKLLVTSRRERIDRVHDVLLDTDVTLDSREEMEDRLLERANLSALVTNIGGVATYPASIPPDRDLDWTLRIAAHEWMHHYFFFKPLGQHMFTSDEMHVLNETAADIIAEEIGRRARTALTLGPADPHLGAEPHHDRAPAAGFEFGTEMRETRLRVDEMLAAGDVEGAEAYMEERRRLFQDNGYYIRKLNQAYFAFHGSYGESPSSVSPIGGQLREMYDLVGDLGEFVRLLSSVSSHQEFLSLLAATRQRATPGS